MRNVRIRVIPNFLHLNVCTSSSLFDVQSLYDIVSSFKRNDPRYELLKTIHSHVYCATTCAMLPFAIAFRADYRFHWIFLHETRVAREKIHAIERLLYNWLYPVINVLRFELINR